MTQDVSRRRFLKQTAFGAVALAFSNFLPDTDSVLPFSPDVERQLSFFSPKEFLIMDAVSARIVGNFHDSAPSAEQVGVALRADKFLAGADPEIQEQFHQLLTVFNAPLFTFLFDFRFSSFLDMKPEDQDTYLEDWMSSALGFRRTGFQALKRTCLSMFYTDQQSWQEIGFGGMEAQGN